MIKQKRTLLNPLKPRPKIPVVLRLPQPFEERTIIVCLNIFQHARPAADTQSLPNTLLA